MGHLVVFNTWGMIATFGVFQQYYTLHLGLEPSAVSWIGSLQMLGHFSLGMLTGRMFDAGLFYWSVIPGMVIAAFGMFMTSLCTKYWQFFLAQGLMNGLGNGMQFAPAMSLITTYFAKNRSVALAIMASGSATGGLVYPTVARQLLPKIGFPWTVRIMGFMMLAVGTCYCSLLKPRLPPRKSGPVLELSAFKELPYNLFLIAVFLICLGQYFAFYYISSFAVDIVNLSYGTSINVLLVLNGIGVLGRLIPSYFADKYTGPYNILIPACFISAIVLYFWPLVNSETGLYGWAITYGQYDCRLLMSHKKLTPLNRLLRGWVPRHLSGCAHYLNQGYEQGGNKERTRFRSRRVGDVHWPAYCRSADTKLWRGLHACPNFRRYFGAAR